ncbi:hypothetical protein C8R47DRAFT_1063229 [Mycena vitilis]|nr:hypothetical protein C8R47DRAFT_1063229 [Mycena vitilis]
MKACGWNRTRVNVNDGMGQYQEFGRDEGKGEKLDGNGEDRDGEIAPKKGKERNGDDHLLRTLLRTPAPLDTRSHAIPRAHGLAQSTGSGGSVWRREKEEAPSTTTEDRRTREGSVKDEVGGRRRRRRRRRGGEEEANEGGLVRHVWSRMYHLAWVKARGRGEGKRERESEKERIDGRKNRTHRSHTPGHNIRFPRVERGSGYPAREKVGGEEGKTYGQQTDWCGGAGRVGNEGKKAGGEEEEEKRDTQVVSLSPQT